MGEKHRVRPTLKKKIWKGIRNKFPQMVKHKTQNIYEYHLNQHVIILIFLIF